MPLINPADLPKYDCQAPGCGAIDSTHCLFRIADSRGDVVVNQQDKARDVGCRVMFYSDLAKKRQGD